MSLRSGSGILRVADSRARPATILRRQERGAYSTGNPVVCQRTSPGWVRLRTNLDRKGRVAKFSTVRYRCGPPTATAHRLIDPGAEVSPATANDPAGAGRPPRSAPQW